jgi:hypothetical protein
MRELRMTDDQLALALTDLGTQIAWPAVPDLRARVLARTSAPRRSAWWRAFWSPRYAFAPALVTVALALIAVLVFSPEARATATDILRLRGIELFRGPVPSPSPTPSRSPGAIQTPTPLPSGLGVLVSLDEAKARAGYTVVVPADPALGAPDQVYLRATPSSTAVSFVYTERAGIPTSPQAGVAAIVTEFSGGTVDQQFFGKVIDPSTTTVEQVTVNGQPGFWIQGTPHFFFYRVGGTAGSVEQETLRLAGNTLIWTQGDLLMRLEAQVDKATALRIAASVQ